ncbi:MAG: type I-G CRISPR-associated protein, Cas3-extension family [Myxococcota bacterium]
MSRTVLKGLSGANPLGFMAAVGLLRIVSEELPAARLGFLDDGSFQPFLDGVEGELEKLVADDAKGGAGQQPWRLEYGKTSKRGTSAVADLKPPPAEFETFLHRVVKEWVRGKPEGAEYAAAYATSVARDGKGNTKPTAFHFTAANQQFLGAVEQLRATVDREWARQSLFEGGAWRPGGNVRWDPMADRNYALMAKDPNDDGTSVDAPLEWLAFRGLPLFPTVPRGTRIVTTGVRGRGEEMRFSWPLWLPAAPLGAVRSVLTNSLNEAEGRELRARGVFAICSSEIRRTAQGFGNFGPASVSRVLG